MSNQPEAKDLITRREAILRVTTLLGGVALIGSGALLTACTDDRARRDAAAGHGEFTADDIAFLDEVADTILPETSTPGAKAARTGAFMALMVTDSYDERDRRAFREGMRTLDEESRAANGAGFMEATPAQRLALLERLDREAKEQQDARERARGSEAAEEEAEQEAAEPLPDQRQEAAPEEAGAAAAVTEDAPPHYFRMMKELALLGYFTSEIGYTQAMRYVESPGRFDPCVPYEPGEKAWAPHA
ncbi:MAG TPA: gluconate 2-dehydrogenase subunit 3 family protein [Gemmatimonadaceae bacterium]